MTKKQIARHRAALVALRAATVAAGPARIEPNRTDSDAVGVADEDAQALSEMLQTLSSARNKQQKELLARIDRALRRIDEAPDDYGRCDDCEEDIAEKRLELMPHASLCAECQAKADPTRGGRRRGAADYQK